MRHLALVILLPLAACDDPRTGDGATKDTRYPDAGCGLNGIGAFEIAAPRPGLHYDKSLDVVIDESELRWSFAVAITDDLGTSFAPISDTEVPFPSDAGSWWSLDTYHFELAANTRYTATVTVCDNRTQMVEFFTSPD
jgi:hypothetical protein